jgi:hypothetical protein
MDLKQCPKCKRYSVSLDFNRGVELCHWRDCNWVNVERKDLPIAHTTVITSHRTARTRGVLARGNLDRGS